MLFKQLYSLSCFGFFLFSQRPLYKTILKAPETGYDINGNLKPRQISFSYSAFNKIKSLRAPDADVSDLYLAS